MKKIHKGKARRRPEIPVHDTRELTPASLEQAVPEVKVSMLHHQRPPPAHKLVVEPVPHPQDGFRFRGSLQAEANAVTVVPQSVLEKAVMEKDISPGRGVKIPEKLRGLAAQSPAA
jgi:hypothetical protein